MSTSPAEKAWAKAKFQEWADEGKVVPAHYSTDDAEHQPRERAVPCKECHEMTWNTNAICADCMGRRCVP
jgi:hypothetical protein